MLVSFVGFIRELAGVRCILLGWFLVNKEIRTTISGFKSPAFTVLTVQSLKNKKLLYFFMKSCNIPEDKVGTSGNIVFTSSPLANDRHNIPLKKNQFY